MFRQESSCRLLRMSPFFRLMKISLRLMWLRCCIGLRAHLGFMVYIRYSLGFEVV